MRNIAEKVKQHRRYLHQIPEIAFDLPKTYKYIKEQLDNLGFTTTILAKTGIVAHIQGELDEAIAFRSDMDALEVTEINEIDFKSTHEGKMHACGHDGHMSILLGFAEYIHQIDLKQSVVLIFQPAEEAPGGARVMIEEGLFDLYPIKAVFGIHLYPDLEEGLYGIVDGPMMPQNAEFDVTIRGVSAHGAQPHLGKDTIVAAATLVSSYQTIVSRSIKPLESAIVTIGTIKGGEARNIISNFTTMSGTMRAYNPVVYMNIKRRMEQICEGIEQQFDVQITNKIVDFYPPVINDSELFLKLKNTLDESEYELIEPLMFSEDFAFYQQKVPGMFVMLGTKNETLGYTHPLHSNKFNFKEEALVKGVELYIKISEMMGIFA